MKIFAGVVALFLFTQSLNAQGISLPSDVSGSPLKLGGKNNVEGNPYYKPNFCSATLYGVDDRIYPEIKSKLNLQTNLVSFIRDNNEEKEYTPSFQVKTIAFTGCSDKNGSLAVFKLGFPSIGIQNENSFYQVLDSGKTTLLKYIQVVETAKPVNGFTAGDGTTTLQKVETYYVYSPAKGIAKISKSSDDVLKALADKRTELDNYLSTNHIKVKKEDDLVKVVQYYNTLN